MAINSSLCTYEITNVYKTVHSARLVWLYCFLWQVQVWGDATRRSAVESSPHELVAASAVQQGSQRRGVKEGLYKNPGVQEINVSTPGGMMSTRKPLLSKIQTGDLGWVVP
ncbi:hypothetical protein GOP47_0014495 [Adiantum capillus-veneris]|uniref:Uncharacterized protein n=1 Tax=Adiantum capillus-veneris TaxID=13818 RepID=A0A9D4UME5_ADICA|nr:hypothetical protein GOP47_0014495 [Adiantum capillus-veneris]